MNLPTPTARSSFWSEAYPAIIETIKIEWRWVVGFAVLYAAVQFFSVTFLGLDALMRSLGADPSSLQKHDAAMKAFASPGVQARFFLMIVMQIIALIIANYCFITLYLRRVVKSSPPQLAVDHFLYWFWQGCKKYLYVLGVGLVSGLVGALVMAVILGATKAAGLPKGVGIFVGVVGVISCLYFYIEAIFRTFLVSPMAILRREPVLKNSKDITKDQCWRIFCGYFPILFFALLFALIPLSVPNFMAGSAAHMLPIILQGVFSTLIVVASVVYCSTVYRILLQERRNTPITVAS